MAKQSVSTTEKPETGSAGPSGFLRSAAPPPPVWLAPPADQTQSFEFFDITRPHFYVIHGVPMAFVSPEVKND